MTPKLPLKVMPVDTPKQTAVNFISPLYIADANGDLVVRITETTHAAANDVERQRAAFIVKACNSHEMLLDSLRRIVGMMDAEEGHLTVSMRPLVKTARMLISECEETL